MLWRKERGRWPANNIEFRRACAALYAEAGGAETDAEPKDGVWRDQLRKAQLKWPKIEAILGWEENRTAKVISVPRSNVEWLEEIFGQKAPRFPDPLAELEALLGGRKS
jgi:hypothetical protein